MNLEHILCSRRSFLAGTALSFLALPARGQASLEEWKRKHAYNNRYEGLVDMHTADADFELLSFTAAMPPFSGSVNLRVKFFSPEQTSVVVYAREVEVQRQYWMESRPITAVPMTWTEFGPWPTRDVLIPEGVDPDNLGVTVRPVQTGSFDFLPAVVSFSGAQLPTEILSYRVFIRSKFDLRQVSWDVVTVDRGGSRTGDTSPIRRVAGVPFPLDVAVPALHDGPAQLVLKGSTAKNAGNPYPINFYHRRRL